MLSSAATLFLKALWVSYESYRGLFGRKILTYINKISQKKLHLAFKYMKESLPLLKVREMQFVIQQVSRRGFSRCWSRFLFLHQCANHKGVLILWKFTISAFLIGTPSVYTLYVNKITSTWKYHISLTDKQTSGRQTTCLLEKAAGKQACLSGAGGAANCQYPWGVSQCLEKLGMPSPFDLAAPSLGMDVKDTLASWQNDSMHMAAYCCLIWNSKRW